jgi:hypothetical protein
MSPARSLLVAITAAALAAGCSDSTGPKGQNVNLAFAGVRPTTGGAAVRASGSSPFVVPGPSDSLVIAVGSDSLIITKVEVVARKIELKGSESSDCDNEVESVDCDELQLAARLFRLPLTAGVSSPVGVDVPVGTYDGIEIHIHKPTSTSGDAAFLAANPTWTPGTSVRVTGFYKNVPFTFTSDVVFKIDQALVPPVTVVDGTSTSVTIRIDVATWFRDSSSGALIDPATAGPSGANRNAVEKNIKDSVKAFRDDDEDGSELDG